MSLGIFDFPAGAGASATIRTDGTTGYVVADAFRWVEIVPPLVLNAPTNLAATVSGGAVNLSWTDNSTSESGSKVERRIGSDPHWEEILYGTTPNQTSFTDSDVTPGTTYSYRVRAYKYQVANSSYSDAVSLTLPALPSAPANLTATAGDAQVTLSWSVASGATNYQVFRSTTSASFNYATPVATVTATSFTNSGLANDATYFYVVRAVNAAGASADSNQASAAPTLPLVLNVPTGLSASVAGTTVNLSWTDTSTGESGYKVQRKVGSGGSWQEQLRGTTPDQISYGQSGLALGTYFYRVFAYKSQVANGPYSAEVSVTIVAPPAPPVNLSATASSTQIALGWSASNGSTSYQVFRSNTSATFNYAVPLATVTTTTYTDSGLTNGTTYFYVVRAANASGASADSNQANATPSAPLAIDAQIRASGAQAWLGAGVYNTTGQNQTLTRSIAGGATRSDEIRLVRSGGADSQTVKVTIPDWSAFAVAGWSARFYDAPENGNDITAQITGTNGWQTVMSAGDERPIRVEVSAPANAAVGQEKTLTVRAGALSDASAVDAVKAVWQAVASAQPDVAISLVDSGFAVGYVGSGQISPTLQQMSAVWGAGDSQIFALQITNTSAAASEFELQAATLPTGWTWKFYDALTGGTLLGDGTTAIVTPSLAPNASVVWRVEVTAVAPATRASLPLRFRGGSLFDEVKIDAALQTLAGLEWSRDGEHWTEVTPLTKLQSQRYATLGFRALKTVPDAPWPQDKLGPTWQWQGVTLEGEQVWLAPHHVTDANGETAQATLGNSFGAKIMVLPDVDLFLKASRGVMAAGATVTISIRSRDENKAGLAGLRVRLRSTKDGANSGHFGEAPPGEVFLLTDAQGNINTTWTADAAGMVQLSAEAVDSADAVFGEGDDWNMEVFNG